MSKENYVVELLLKEMKQLELVQGRDVDRYEDLQETIRSRAMKIEDISAVVGKLEAKK